MPDLPRAREYLANALDELGHEPGGRRFQKPPASATKAVITAWADDLRAHAGLAFSWITQATALLADDDAPPDDGGGETEAPGPEVPPGRHHVQWGDAGQQSFDVHIPGVLHGAPVLVLVPGGGWQMDAATPSGLVPWLQRYGIVVEVNYRLQSGMDCAHDVATAVRLTSEHAARWGGSADRICLIGHSAGGWAAWLVALEPAWGCPMPASVVSLAGALFPPTGTAGAPAMTQQLIAAAFGGDYPRFAPASHLDDRGQRLRGIVVHGTADDQIPDVWAWRFAQTARDHGHDVRLHLVNGGGHALDPAVDGRVAEAIEWAVQGG